MNTLITIHTVTWLISVILPVAVVIILTLTKWGPAIKQGYEILKKADSILETVIAQFPQNQLFINLNNIVDAVLKALQDGGVTVTAFQRRTVENYVRDQVMKRVLANGTSN